MKCPDCGNEISAEMIEMGLCYVCGFNRFAEYEQKLKEEAERRRREALEAERKAALEAVKTAVKEKREEAQRAIDKRVRAVTEASNFAKQRREAVASLSKLSPTLDFSA